MPRIVLGRLSDFPDRGGQPCRLGDRAVAVFRSGERIFVVDDRCPHRGFPLHDGVLDGGTVRCRTHGATFDLASGALRCGPARRGVRVWAAQVVDGEVVVEVPDHP